MSRPRTRSRRLLAAAAAASSASAHVYVVRHVCNNKLEIDPNRACVDPGSALSSFPFYGHSLTAPLCIIQTITKAASAACENEPQPPKITLPVALPEPKRTQTRVHGMSSLAAFAPSLAALRPKAAKTSKVSKAMVAERRTETVVPAISTRRVLLGGAVSAAMTLAMSPGPAAAKDGKNGVYWIEPKDGATVAREFNVKMGVIGYELAPASEGLQEGTGHHHIVVDQEGGYVEKGVEIPFDATHLHFGKAQKEGAVKLEPGTHTLTLQFADAKHRSFGKKFAKTITVNVE